MKQIKIRDKEYNCSNKVYYHIQGLESENRVISMELLGHENNELQQQKEIERLNKENKELNKICARKSHYIDKKDLEIGRLNNIINKAIEYIEKRKNLNWYADGVFVYELLNILQGVDKE